MLELLRSTPALEIEQPVLIGAELQLPGRLIAVRVAPAVADARRRKLKEKVRRGKRKAYTAEYLALQDRTLWITNVPDALTHLLTTYGELLCHFGLKEKRKPHRNVCSSLAAVGLA